MVAADTPSVAERARLIAAGAPVVGTHYLKETAVFVLGEEALLFVADAGEPVRAAVHGGAILESRSDSERLRLLAVSPSGKATGSIVHAALAHPSQTAKREAVMR